MDPVSWLTSIPGIGPYLPYIMAAVSICAVICTIMPPPTSKSPKAYMIFYGVINWVALNLGHAKNAEAPSSIIVKKE